MLPAINEEPSFVTVDLDLPIDNMYKRIFLNDPDKYAVLPLPQRQTVFDLYHFFLGKGIVEGRFEAMQQSLTLIHNVLVQTAQGGTFVHPKTLEPLGTVDDVIYCFIQTGELLARFPEES
jgi:hypothetical protein